MNQGRIIKQISNDYTVESDGNLILCKCRGIFRKNAITPMVGDDVVFDKEKKIITEILPRKNFLIRPIISNVDQAIIITSVKAPDFSTNLLDKLLVCITFQNVKPIIILTKLDLLTEKEKEELKPQIDYYKKYYSVFENTNLKDIYHILDHKVSVFAGQSGAGKSTLLNHLNPLLNLQTNEISKALGRGKHTTRHVELLKVKDGFVADTPGFSSLDFRGMTKEDIKNCFPEFQEYPCKYHDCMHTKESECEIKKKVKEGLILPSRYENYLKFLGSD